PQALLLDEPLSALDPRTRAAASRELRGVLREAGVPSILVTHNFAEAAAFGDRVAVLDAGRVVQHGTPAALAATPASAFVADFAGAVVLTGTVRSGTDAGATVVDLDGGGTVSSTDAGEGRVAASVFPWEIVLEPTGDDERVHEARPTSARNRLDATIISVTVVGGRARIGLAAGQPLVAEISEASVSQLGLQPGDRVSATWKAAATRLVLA
ncbi:MAG: TOBE domain-containing protein, partial [Solirubrobacteraceae bacterium]|nr:TOBE domain-containing protein [Solirubrobacteraceae bacterium]